MSYGHSFKTVTGKISVTDCSPAQSLIAAEAGYTLYLKKLIMCSNAQQQLTLEDSDGVDLCAFSTVQGTSIERNIDFGDFPVTASKGLQILSSGNGEVTCFVVCWKVPN